MDENNPTRRQAELTLHYVEGWLSGADYEDASRYLREVMDELLDQMVEDECAHV